MSRDSACPYLGLEPYDEQDWEYFFGRERETELIIANQTAARLTLLFGASGVGKSSVLRAGVGHSVSEQAARNRTESGVPEVVIAVFRTWRDEPLAGIVAAIRHAVARAIGRDPGLPDDEPLARTLARWTDLVGGDIMVVLDQFEEFFLYHSHEDGPGTFAVEFPRLVNDPRLRVNFLVAMRDDSVAKLDRFKGRIPNLFDNYLRLDHLGLEAAEAAIRRPLAAYNRRHPDAPVTIENELVSEVLRQTRTRFSALDELAPESGWQIATPYLQMVMTRLWDAEMAAGSRVLRYATLVDRPPRGLGGAEHIVRTHLDDQMDALEPAERSVAAQALRFLVTRSGTKIALAVEDLASYTGLPIETLGPVLEKLAAGERRILRPVSVPDQPGASRYELFHDVLSAAVTDWRKRYELVRDQQTKLREQEERRQAELRAAEQRRLRERTRYLYAGLVVIGAGFVTLAAMSWVAWEQRGRAVAALEKAETARAQAVEEREKARYALDQAERALKEAEYTARAGIEARSRQTGAEEGRQLRDAFLRGDNEFVEYTARRLGLLNTRIRFRAEAIPKDYRIEDKPSFEYRMRPVPDSVPGGLRSLAWVSFKMNHPTFKNKVLAGDPAQGFRGSYVGWGCLSRVPVLLEYVDTQRPPEVSIYEMCASIETAGR